ncbi:g10235 [Coccomyxa viridis]|uniref:protein-ribulosamine 3-kinase n=1 Tax=Coccomyxa viridis TaxID=1274662 RepID=A0ABP1G4W6_9CHLO
MRSSSKASTVQCGIDGWIEQNLDSGRVVSRNQVSSSSWSSASVYTTDSGTKYFVKQSKAGADDGMFKGEALGLQAMYGTHTLRIPKVFHYGQLADAPGGRGLGGGGYFIVMEHLNFTGRASQEELGRGLAQMHLAEPTEDNAKQGKFGFPVDNTIGGNPQPNGWMDNWVDFYRERRLRHMLRLVNDSRLTDMGERVAKNMDKMFEGVKVKPSLLHGDLWSGNLSVVEGGQWAILDPACYYGHHEADFGMQWCAGFSGPFWQAYHEVIPKDPGFEDRKQLYMLYHYLNHTSLFGGMYKGSAESILRHLSTQQKRLPETYKIASRQAAPSLALVGSSLVHDRGPPYSHTT